MSFEKIGKRETLSEKVASRIKESILNNVLKAGSPIPTEPELEKQFGVSRMVIRDAIRILKTQGLIEVTQGKGMFVALPKIEAFNDSLLTILRRENATAWDVEQFENIIFPQILALASSEATKEDIINTKLKANKYLETFKKWVDSIHTHKKIEQDRLYSEAQEDFKNFMHTLFDCTHNKMVKLIGTVLLSLRKWRNVQDISDISLYIYEKKTITRYIEILEINDFDEAAKKLLSSINFNDGIKNILKSTPVGASPQIPSELFFSTYLKENNSKI